MRDKGRALVTESIDRLPYGKGKLDFKAFHKALKEVKYEGPAHIVFSCKNINKMRESREFIRELEKE